MQINDSVKYLNGATATESAAQDHPLGEATLGASGTLALRSRLLRAAELDVAGSLDLPFTTGTAPLS